MDESRAFPSLSLPERGERNVAALPTIEVCWFPNSTSSFHPN